MPQKGPDTSKIRPVILSGGSGTRLWPMSRESYPKQLLSLVSDNSLLQDTVARVTDAATFAPPVLVSNNEHRFIIAEQVRALEVTPDRIILEPAGRNTAPAVASAALMLAADDQDALMLVLPSDHTISDAAGFEAAVKIAAEAARGGALVTFGIRPDTPHTGYGYIKRGADLGDVDGCCRVEKFVEKPNAKTAAAYLKDGGYFWNSGMFLFSARNFLEELARLEPEMLAGCQKAVDNAASDLDFIRLDGESFTAVPSRSIDYAVMEHTDRAAVVPVDIGWSDVGSWGSLWEISGKDPAGNVAAGDVELHDVRSSYVRSEGPLVAALGVENLVIVATADVVLVLPRERAQDVRLLVDALKASDRQEASLNPRVYRPWGFYQGVHEGERFQVKRITVNPGASLSLQKHLHRAEHWIVVYGVAEVTRGEDTFTLHENESTYIPPSTVHRLTNPGKTPLDLIEVQTGSYLGEDDIIRLEDHYGRS